MPKYAIVANTKMPQCMVCLSICPSVCLWNFFLSKFPKIDKNKPKLVQNWLKYAIVANTKNASMHGMSVHLSVCLSVRLSVKVILKVLILSHLGVYIHDKITVNYFQ